MSEPTTQERALAAIVAALRLRNRAHALVGGLAVSARAEPRFTRDVDVAVTVADDADAEALVHELVGAGYQPIATVEHTTAKRLSTARLGSPEGTVVDLLFASCGIEREINERATEIEVPGLGKLRVARAEELVAMKVLSMRDARLQDRLDAMRLLEIADPDLDEVRQNLALITGRGYHRDQDLARKLDELIAGREPE